MKKTDLESLRRIIRYISTSDPAIQNEVLRLDAALERELTERQKKTKHQ